MENKKIDLVVYMMMLENGEIETVEELVEGMVMILNDGLLSGLQGSYSHLAENLIEAGYIEEVGGKFQATH